MNQSYEECDDGRQNGRWPGGCRANCRRARCGDGILDPGEHCDDGNASDTDFCSSACRWRIPDLPPNPWPPVTTPPRPPFCGDGILQPPEACDDGMRNADRDDFCRTTCERPYCGDGIRNSGEECDDGNYVYTDACDNNCRRNRPQSICGNGVRELGEQCDDGNPNENDGCTSRCTSNIQAAAPLATLPSITPRPVCGDGALSLDEECDDGNRRTGDGCSSVCKHEPLLTPPPLPLLVPSVAYAPEPLPTPRRQPDTGPAVIIFIATGAAAGIAVTRRYISRRDSIATAKRT